jgi:hypothetical protein
MGRNGNPADGYGPNGHTGICVSTGPGTVTCIESRGGVGVCYKTRRREEWDGFCRVDGMTPHVVGGMHVWESMYDAFTGTVAHVGYYSGPDVVNDGHPDRAWIGDGNGIDCSGAVKLCADYGYDHAAGQPAPQPPPPPPPPLWAGLDDEEDMSRVATFPFNNQAHSVWVDEPSKHLFHSFVDSGGKHGFEDLSTVTGIGALTLDRPTVSAAGSCLVVGVFGAADNVYVELRYDGKGWGAAVPGH